jgi:hypothetical protein
MGHLLERKHFVSFNNSKIRVAIFFRKIWKSEKVRGNDQGKVRDRSGNF